MGDLLPSTLYISYLRMLKGLANGPQCAHYCFSLLKTNGAAHSKTKLLYRIYLFIYFSDISVEINTFDLKLSLSTKGTSLCCSNNNNNNNVFVCFF